jgi:asparagine synthase (glutamine-hydrolysing)
MDQPSFDGINSFVISQAVRSAGFKVALSGLGGDELFAGYSTFTASPDLESWQRAVQRVPGFLRWPLPGLAAIFSQSEDQKNKLRTVLSPPFPHPYGVLRTMFVPAIRKRLLKDFQDAMDTAAQAPFAQSVEESRDMDGINRVSYLELTNYMRNTLLRDTDGMSMANSLEVRVPFVDQELLGYVAGLRGSMKRDGMRPKTLLTGAFEDVLPKAVVSKTKQGFTLPFRHWLLDDLHSTLEDSFATMNKGVLGTYLAPESVRATWSDFEAGKTSWTRPWSLFVLQRWCQYNLE